jgi:uncharacterized protein
MFRKISHQRLLLISFILFLSVFYHPIAGQDLVYVPDINSYVTDQTGTLDQLEKQTLENKLQNLEETKGSQIIILLIPSTYPEEIEQFGIRVADTLRIGRKGIDDGVILIVAKDDRKVRIEVGYGLEGAIPDAYAKRIINQIIIPQFRDGKYSAGIGGGVDALIALIEGEELPLPTAQSGGDGAEKQFPVFFFFIIIMIVVLPVVKSMFGSKMKSKAARIITFIIALALGWLIINLAMGLIMAIFLTFFMSIPSGGPRGGSRGGYIGPFGGFGRGGSIKYGKEI